MSTQDMWRYGIPHCAKPEELSAWVRRSPADLTLVCISVAELLAMNANNPQ